MTTSSTKAKNFLLGGPFMKLPPKLDGQKLAENYEKLFKSPIKLHPECSLHSGDSNHV
jgi:hypothetical protein